MSKRYKRCEVTKRRKVSDGTKGPAAEERQRRRSATAVRRSLPCEQRGSTHCAASARTNRIARLAPTVHRDIPSGYSCFGGAVSATSWQRMLELPAFRSRVIVLVPEFSMRIATLGRSVWFVATIVTVAGCARLLQAQGISSLEPGARVRLFTPSVGRGGLVGTVVRPVRDTLAILPAKGSDTVVVAVAELTRLELSTGRHPHALKGMGIGLLVGAAGGAIAGWASGDDRGWFGLTAGEKARIGATLFGVAGSLVGGAIIGRATEGWEVVRLPSGSRISVAPRGNAHVALAYSVAF